MTMTFDREFESFNGMAGVFVQMLLSQGEQHVITMLAEPSYMEN